jgi:hypothetical protein
MVYRLNKPKAPLLLSCRYWILKKIPIGLSSLVIVFQTNQSSVNNFESRKTAVCFKNDNERYFYWKLKSKKKITKFINSTSQSLIFIIENDGKFYDSLKLHFSKFERP